VKQNFIAFIKAAGIALLAAIAIGSVLTLIGLLAKWTTAVEFSNAFFIAGSVVIIIGISFVLGGDIIRGDVRIYYASGVKVNERINRVMTDTLQAYRGLIAFSMCGVFLIAASVVIGSLFSG
jgi:hypothetical protein